MRKSKPSKLLDANTAVESYLDNLLQEATESVDIDVEVKAKAKAKAKVTTKPQVKTKVDNVHLLETPLTETVTEIQQLTELAPVEQSEQSIDDEVEALQFPIQCLMFKVGDSLLSVPLVRMGSVVPWGGRLSQLPYSPEYFKGLLKHREQNVKVVDTEVLLHQFSGQKTHDHEFAPSHILVFKDNDWAISCDMLMDVVTLNEDDVKWHVDATNRLSLGTIKQSLALVLSPDAIIKKLIIDDKD